MDDRVRKSIVNMAETMYETPGVGLIATQADVHERMTTTNVFEPRDELRMSISPEILWVGDEHEVRDEGCLSVSDIYDEVDRPARVCVWILNEKGETFELEADDLLTVRTQHGMDYLMGKVFVEHLSPLRQMHIRSKLKKHQHDAAPQR